ncbi:MAG: DUF3450 domain-containing protein, partial [Pseudomonadales bacterium]|nr:DUF3450 domain-containing protein [Pseudomonadales bacterium]
TARSNLRREVLDVLHEGGVEIVSPSFMNQRPVADGNKVIPVKPFVDPTPDLLTPDEPIAEEMVFDKAEQAEQINKEKSELVAALEELQSIKKNGSDDEKAAIKEQIERIQDQLKALELDPPESE